MGGVVTVFAQLPAAAVMASADCMCEFRVVAMHPSLAKTMIGKSPPFFIVKSQISIDITPLGKHDAYLPGGTMQGAPIVDVENNIDRLALKRSVEKAGVVVRQGASASSSAGRMYTQAEHEQGILEMRAKVMAEMEIEKNEAIKRTREERDTLASEKLQKIAADIQKGTRSPMQIVEDTILEFNLALRASDLPIHIKEPIFTIRFHKPPNGDATAEFRANSKIDAKFCFDMEEMLTMLKAASSVQHGHQSTVLYPFQHVYFKLTVVNAADNAPLCGEQSMCLTTDSGKTCSNRIVGTIDVIQCVKIYKVPVKKHEIRLSLEVVKDTSEINAPHITRNDQAIADAFAANGLHVSAAYTEPFVVQVTPQRK